MAERDQTLFLSSLQGGDFFFLLLEHGTNYYKTLFGPTNGNVIPVDQLILGFGMTEKSQMMKKITNLDQKSAIWP